MTQSSPVLLADSLVPPRGGDRGEGRGRLCSRRGPQGPRVGPAGCPVALESVSRGPGPRQDWQMCALSGGRLFSPPSTWTDRGPGLQELLIFEGKRGIWICLGSFLIFPILVVIPTLNAVQTEHGSGWAEDGMAG